MSPGLAKNTIRRSLRAILDPEPSDRDVAELWVHFGARCAYCGRDLRRELREAHVDHLISASLGGSNGIANKVLSCATCNGDEKGDLPWEEFLRAKSVDSATFEQRKELISSWLALRPAGEPIDEDLLRSAQELALAAFDAAVVLLRESRKAKPPRPGRPSSAGSSAPGTADFHQACIDDVARHLAVQLVPRSRATFGSADGRTTVVCLVSSGRQQAGGQLCWFALQERQVAELAAADDAYLVLGCGRPEDTLAIPASVVLSLIEGFNVTQKSNRGYFHVRVLVRDGRFSLIRKSGYERVDLTDYRVAQEA